MSAVNQTSFNVIIENVSITHGDVMMIMIVKMDLMNRIVVSI